MFGTNSSISQETEKDIFRTTVRFFSVPTGIWIAAGPQILWLLVVSKIVVT
jgi:hypothetical protein